MKTVLITGAGGFIGKNLRAQLELDKNIHILTFDRSNSSKDLRDYISKADFIFHLAGVMRPKDETEFSRVNTDLTAEILAHIDAVNKTIPILITSSIQAELDNPYGVSKRAAEKVVTDWSSETGNPAYVYRLPNVFGKWARPNYSSVVATFCHNIANDLEVTIHEPSKIMQLAYIDDVIDEFIHVMNEAHKVDSDAFLHIEQLHSVSLESLANKIRAFRQAQVEKRLPRLDTLFDSLLYATYSSYSQISDLQFEDQPLPDEFGSSLSIPRTLDPMLFETFISVTKSGMMRTEPEHRSEVQWLLFLDGDASIDLKDHYSDTSVTFSCVGFSSVEVPAGFTYTLTNNSSTHLTVFHQKSVSSPDKLFKIMEVDNE